MTDFQEYPIGTPGTPWGPAEKKQWFSIQEIRRSYDGEVMDRLRTLNPSFELESYGALSVDPARYPLVAAISGQWKTDKPTILVTGGVHGYETSGVQGAIRFLKTRAEDYIDDFNIVVAPCVSPWGYETINRWNPQAIDPNRSFYPDTPAEEAAALMAFLHSHDIQPLVHIDLHETTDTDNSEFRPALGARDGKAQEQWDIPDGFYTVGDSARPVAEFQGAIIESVARVTHIAPADEHGKIIGETLQQPGVINYDAQPLGLCMGFTAATFVTTTEVYPDSPQVDDENCIIAQVAAVEGGLGYVLQHL